MSGTFPSTVGFETLDFQSNVQNRVTVAVSGKAQRIRVGAQYWSFKLKSPAMTRADFMTAYSFIVKQDGQYGSFTVVPPTIASTRGTASGTVTVNATVAAGQLTCNTTGGTGTLKKGDLIKFSNHDKVYMLTEDVDLDGSTVDTLNFYPNLVTGITNTTTITYNNVPLKVYLDSDQQKYITQADGTYKYEITLNEEI
jgi:hypothetical protein